jgi:acetyltransferase-like isoleucine patch superfamily enzyme
MVAPDCRITDVNQGSKPGRLLQEQPLASNPVENGPDVWPGAGCSLLPGIRTGHGCVVGARGMVTKVWPDYAKAVGMPAKPVEYRTPPDGIPPVSAGNS